MILLSVGGQFVTGDYISFLRPELLFKWSEHIMTNYVNCGECFPHVEYLIP